MESPLRRRITADYTVLNRNVFNCFLKAGSVKLELLRSFVNEFQKVGLETANIREPNWPSWNVERGHRAQQIGGIVGRQCPQLRWASPIGMAVLFHGGTCRPGHQSWTWSSAGWEASGACHGCHSRLIQTFLFSSRGERLLEGLTAACSLVTCRFQSEYYALMIIK